MADKGRTLSMPVVFLLAVGVFLVALGVLVATVVAPRLVVLPADEYVVFTTSDPDATYLDVPKLREVRHTTVTNVQTVRGDVRASHGGVVVWDTFAATRAVNGTPIAYAQARVALDRRTGWLRACCGANADGHRVPYTGYLLKLPFHTGRRDYPFYDAVLNRTVTARYTGTETIGGLTVYRFAQHVPPTPFTRMTVPGSFVGSKKASVRAARYYADDRMYWVEPTTGMFVRVQDHHRETFRDAAGRDRTVAFDGNMRMSAQTRRTALAAATSTRTQVVAVDAAPWVAGGAGLLMIIGGATLAARRARRRPRTPAPETVATFT